MERPAETILAFAEKHGVYCIVMSTHVRTGVGRCVFARVADSSTR